MTAFRRLCVASTVATFLLIGVGGLVRATGSGLGCGDDWPECGGKLVPSMAHLTTAIEYTHRLVAATVIVLIGSLVVSAFRTHRENRPILIASTGALLLVLGQAVLGAIVVKLDLHAISVVLHLAAALSLVALLIYLTGLAFAADGSLSGPTTTSGSRLAAVAAGATLVQLLIGSYVSGRDAGLTYKDWPLMDGKIVPPMPGSAYALQFTHRAVAVIAGVVVLAAVIAFIRRRDILPAAARLAWITASLYLLEILIGGANVLTSLNSAVVTAHLLTGALIWGSLVGMFTITVPSVRQVTLSRRAPSSRSVLEGGR
jgi:heme A synthase